MLYLLLNCFTKEKSLQVPGLHFVSLICHRTSTSHWGSPKMQHTQELFHEYPTHSQNLCARTMHLVLILTASTMYRWLLVTVNSCRQTPCTISAALEFCVSGGYKWSSTNCIKQISLLMPLCIQYRETNWIPHCCKEMQVLPFTGRTVQLWKGKMALPF